MPDDQKKQKKQKTIMQFWEEFAARVLPPNCPEAQRKDMRNAFFAGAYIILGEMTFTIGDEGVSEEEGMDMLDDLHRECKNYFEQLAVTPKPKQ